jgi:hypothetical protein
MNYINKFLGAFGVELHKSRSLKNEKEFYKGNIDRISEFYITSMIASNNNFNKRVNGIVFSKDRAMQLHALLLSYFHYTRNPAKLIILFTCSNNDHEISYQLLQKEFESFPVSFVKEADFPVQLKEIVSSLTSDRLFFMTDDAVFLDNYDLNDCLQFNPINNIFSLRLGPDLDFCYAHNITQNLPEFKGEDLLNKTFKIWNWADKPDSPDWSYPLSLDATIFFRKEIELIFGKLAFTSPNSLESQMQLYKELFLVRNGICFPKAKYVNVPCNLVQEEFNNKSNNSHSIEELVSYFLKGKRINWKKLEGLKAPEAQKTIFTFTDSEGVIGSKKTKSTD